MNFVLNDSGGELLISGTVGSATKEVNSSISAMPVLGAPLAGKKSLA